VLRAGGILRKVRIPKSDVKGIVFKKEGEKNDARLEIGED
jgi:hypothetical protein